MTRTRFIRFRMLEPDGKGVYTERRSGLVKTDTSDDAGSAITNLVNRYAPYPGDVIELEYSKSYCYVTFKWEDENRTRVVLETPFVYEAKN